MSEIILNIIDESDKNKSVIIALSGDLGVGKTSAVQYIAQKLDITETIQSPTFVIKKNYKVPDNNRFSRLVHTDAYRLEHQSHEPLQFANDFNDEKVIMFIEWPEMIKNILPEHTQWITIEHCEQGRIIEYKKTP